MPFLNQYDIFSSDLHFYHDNVIKHANRPFVNAQEMNEALVRNWNGRVNASDDIYIFGDVTMKGATYANEILGQLNGNKYLIKGNQDRFTDQQSLDKSLFIWIKDYHEFNVGKDQFILFHYPIEEWNGFFRGSFHLHRHQHNHEDYNYKNRKKGLRRYDVGVDANQMAPVSLEEIFAFFELKNK